MQASSAALDEAHQTQWDALVLGWGYMGQGQVEQALAALAPGLAGAERSGNKARCATFHENIGFQNYLGGRFAAAREHLTQALSLYEETASELRAVNALQHLCRTLVAEGELDRARQRLEQAVELEVAANERWAADGRHILGEIHVLRAEWELAVPSFELALATRRAVGDSAGIVESSVGLGLAQQHRGMWPAAAEAFDAAVAVAERIDPAPCRVLALCHRARLRLLRGERTAAAADVERALAVAESMRDTLEYALGLRTSAQLQFSGGDLVSALALANQALAHARPIDQTAEVHCLLASIQTAIGDASDARASARAALEAADRMTAPRLRVLALLALARAEALQDGLDADRTFTAALEAADAAGSPGERAEVLRSYAEYLDRCPAQAERAAAFAAEARALLDRLGAVPDGSSQPAAYKPGPGPW